MRIVLNGHSLREAQIAAWQILLEGRKRPKGLSPFAIYKPEAHGHDESRGLRAV